MKRKTISVLVFKVQCTPKVEEIDNTLEAQQKIVGGYIEAVALPRKGVFVICNEEGKLNGLLPNRIMGRDILVGDFFVTKINAAGDNVSLTDTDIEFAQQFFYGKGI